MPIPSVLTVFALLHVPNVSVASAFPARANPRILQVPKPSVFAELPLQYRNIGICGVSSTPSAQSLMTSVV